ncbi:MAG: acyltransferase [Thermoleophilia bacterium]|nr:acyltransferase [Thermoleophilia bacterium]
MPSARQDKASTGFRPDIEGLRAIAIGAVLLCHAGIPFAAGGYVGVDVFFVISGFLITRLLLNEVGRRNTISIRGFYARRIKRLLPLSAVLLVSVAILSLVILSPVRIAEVSGDIISSAFYTANWHFAAQSVDYFAQEAEPSPVQHLWSLAIEEQFYLVWPTLLLAVTWFGRRRGHSIRPALWVTLGIIFVASLAFGIYYTGAQPPAAYFSTFGRAWELALGALLALLGVVGMPRRAAVLLGWAGLAAIVYAVLAFDATTPFPGTVALIPTLGTAALILAGGALQSRNRATPTGILSTGPARYVGGISYSWYLWHWPLLVFAAALWGPLSVAADIAVVAFSWIPTAITHYVIEEPFRRSKKLVAMPSRAFALGAACMALMVGGALMLDDSQPTLKTAPLSQVKGAAALETEVVPQDSAEALRPNPLRAKDDRSQAFYDGCLVGIGGTNSNRCLYGDPDGTKTLILFGDSHAMQYFPPLEQLAMENHWRLIILTKAECTPGEVPIRSMVADREYSQCDAWREETLRRIEMSGSRAMVVMSGDTAYTPYGDEGQELTGKEGADALEAGYLKTLNRIHRAGLQVTVIRDTPTSSSDVPSCVSEDLQNLDKCAFERVRDWDKEFDVRAAKRSPHTFLIDVTAEICPGELCRAVIGNALVYRDKSHLTATFARTLSPWIGTGIKEADLF